MRQFLQIFDLVEFTIQNYYAYEHVHVLYHLTHAGSLITQITYNKILQVFFPTMEVLSYLLSSYLSLTTSPCWL
jgi:hypothetical protein